MHDNLAITVSNLNYIKQCHPSNFPVLFSDELKALVIKKKTAYRIYKLSRLWADYHTFNSLRRQCKNLTEECYQMYINKAESSINNNPKTFWKFMLTQTDHGSIPSVRSLGTKVHQMVLISIC